MLELTFYMFAALLIFASTMVICVRNTVYAVLFLIFAFFNAAALAILIGAEYIALTTVVVYVGAVAVLFLFVVMMIDVNRIAKNKRNFVPILQLAVFLSLIVFLEIHWAFRSSIEYVINPNIDVRSQPSSNNIMEIGSVLYTTYSIHLQIAGLILLSSMVGAILLTLKHDKFVKRQNIRAQISRRRKDCVDLIDVKSEQGIKEVI